MTVPGCSDVCEYIHIELVRLGFKINKDDPDHTDILEALEQIKIVKVG